MSDSVFSTLRPQTTDTERDLLAKIALASGSLHNVRAFGALGDGVTDDTLAIQAALDASVAAGGTCYIPEGDYLVTDSIILDTGTHLVSHPAGWIVRGFQGGGITGACVKTGDCVDPASGSAHDSPAEDVTDITVDGLNIRTDDDAFDGHLLAICSAGDVRMRRLNLGRSYAPAWGMVIWANRVMLSEVVIRTGPELTEDGLHIYGGQNIIIDNVDIESGDDCIAISPPEDIAASDIIITNARLKSTKAYAIKINANAPLSGGSRFLERILISNVVAESGIDRNGGIYIRELGTPRGCIRNVTVRDFEGEICTGTHDGTDPQSVQMIGCSHVLFENVRIRGNHQEAVYITSAQGPVTFRRCYFEAPSTAATDNVRLTSCGTNLITFEDCHLPGQVAGNKIGQINNSDARFVGCTFYSDDTAHFTATFTPSVQSIEFIGCVFSGSSAVALSSGSGALLRLVCIGNSLLTAMATPVSVGLLFSGSTVVMNNAGWGGDQVCRHPSSLGSANHKFSSTDNTKQAVEMIVGGAGDQKMVHNGNTIQIRTHSTDVGGQSLYLNPTGYVYLNHTTLSGLIVGGNSATSGGAGLELKSTSKALLLSRLTTAQRNAITSPTDGMVIYNSETGQFEGRAGGAWVAL